MRKPYKYRWLGTGKSFVYALGNSESSKRKFDLKYGWIVHTSASIEPHHITSKLPDRNKIWQNKATAHEAKSTPYTHLVDGTNIEWELQTEVKERCTQRKVQRCTWIGVKQSCTNHSFHLEFTARVAAAASNTFNEHISFIIFGWPISFHFCSCFVLVGSYSLFSLSISLPFVCQAHSIFCAFCARVSGRTSVAIYE